VTLSLREGEIVGVVGESGSGKSTLARALLCLLPLKAGEVILNGIPFSALSERKRRPLRPEIQMIFQDPYGSLNPRMRVGEILKEGLKAHKRGTPKEQEELIGFYLERVGLKNSDARRYPHEFSGGQRQRIGIARALILRPRFLIADEPTSSLDVSVEAQILNLLLELRESEGFGLIFISHDLKKIVSHLADRILVMYAGMIVEEGTPRDLLNHPAHPYTAMLLHLVPRFSPKKRELRVPIPGEPPSPAHLPPGCAFHPRCPYAKELCMTRSPSLVPLPVSSTHRVACHFPLA
jgi:oligopeptide/dipeptide ABC transporter ATP-binding protein